jgi:hypothetical protein
MDALSSIVAGVFGAEKLEEFKASLTENQELASLLVSGKKVVGRSIAGNEETITRKPRGAVKPKADDVRCQALVWMLEKNAAGEWIPQRCTRGCEGESDYCKSHGAVDGKKCGDCSAYHGEDVVHGFKHEHLGTIHERSYVIDKFWNELVRYTERQQKLKSGELVPSSSKKAEKKVSASLSEEKTVKARRVTSNPYMKWLASVRGEIKTLLLEENPDMGKGREITTAVTKKAGEIWKLMSKEEKDQWKGEVVLAEASAEMPPVIDDADDADDAAEAETDSPVSAGPAEQQQQTASEEDDDTIKLVFNETHSVWVDEDTGLYYETDDAETPPLGQMNGGKPVAFKKVSKK